MYCTTVVDRMLPPGGLPVEEYNRYVRVDVKGRLVHPSVVAFLFMSDIEISSAFWRAAASVPHHLTFRM